MICSTILDSSLLLLDDKIFRSDHNRLLIIGDAKDLASRHSLFRSPQRTPDVQIFILFCFIIGEHLTMRSAVKDL
jgi:hypothetical protein